MHNRGERENASKSVLPDWGRSVPLDYHRIIQLGHEGKFKKTEWQRGV